MNIWVMAGTCEGETFASTHLTKKGALLAGIGDVLEFLGVEDEETALEVMNRKYQHTETDGEHTEPIEWSFKKMKEMDYNKLCGIFGEWSELTWDNDHGYQLDILKTMIQA